jgi:hypothetical protein
MASTQILPGGNRSGVFVMVEVTLFWLPVVVVF